MFKFDVGDLVYATRQIAPNATETYPGTIFHRTVLQNRRVYGVKSLGTGIRDLWVDEQHLSLREESETMVYDVGGTVIEFKDLMDGDTAAFRMASGAWYVAKVEYAAEAHRGFVNVQGKITVDKLAYGEVRLLHRSFDKKALSVREAIENVLGTGSVSDVALTKLVKDEGLGIIE